MEAAGGAGGAEADGAVVGAGVSTSENGAGRVETVGASLSAASCGAALSHTCPVDDISTAGGRAGPWVGVGVIVCFNESVETVVFAKGSRVDVDKVELADIGKWSGWNSVAAQVF